MVCRVFLGGPLSDDYTQKGLRVFLLIKTDGWEWVRAIAKAEVFLVWEIGAAVERSSSRGMEM